MEIPSVFTLSGIANDFVENRKNALVVDFKNSEEIDHSLIEIFENERLRKDIIKQAKADVSERFNIERMVEQLDKLYESI